MNTTLTMFLLKLLLVLFIVSTGHPYIAVLVAAVAFSTSNKG